MVKNEKEETGTQEETPEAEVKTFKHASWPMQVLEANRQGDVDALVEAFQRDGGDINTVTVKGGYGGFRYITWGTDYGGHPDGETILHLVLRPDNSHYPRRYEMAKAIVNLGVDVTLRSATGKTARDHNKQLVDALYPLSRWTTDNVTAWLASRGRALRYKNEWVAVLQTKKLTGSFLEDHAHMPELKKWVADNLSKLTRLGFQSEYLDREMRVLHKVINQVRMPLHDTVDELGCPSVYWADSQAQGRPSFPINLQSIATPSTSTPFVIFF